MSKIIAKSDLTTDRQKEGSGEVIMAKKKKKKKNAREANCIKGGAGFKARRTERGLER